MIWVLRVIDSVLNNGIILLYLVGRSARCSNSKNPAFSQSIWKSIFQKSSIHINIIPGNCFHSEQISPQILYSNVINAAGFSIIQGLNLLHCVTSSNEGDEQHTNYTWRSMFYTFKYVIRISKLHRHWNSPKRQNVSHSVYVGLYARQME